MENKSLYINIRGKLFANNCAVGNNYGRHLKYQGLDRLTLPSGNPAMSELANETVLTTTIMY